SGLSHADRTTPRQVVIYLDRVRSDPAGAPLYQALPLAGSEGTLRHRMRGTAAAGRCRAKTGTLNGVSNLAGWCTARNGDLVVFAILMSRVNIYGAHVLQDRMAATIA